MPKYIPLAETNGLGEITQLGGGLVCFMEEVNPQKDVMSFMEERKPDFCKYYLQSGEDK